MSVTPLFLRSQYWSRPELEPEVVRAKEEESKKNLQVKGKESPLSERPAREKSRKVVLEKLPNLKLAMKSPQHYD